MVLLSLTGSTPKTGLRSKFVGEDVNQRIEVLLVEVCFSAFGRALAMWLELCASHSRCSLQMWRRPFIHPDP